MTTRPCGHRVICRKCFVRTIQSAITQRCFSLRCVVCRTKILKLREQSRTTQTLPTLHSRSSVMTPPAPTVPRLTRSMFGLGPPRGPHRSSSTPPMPLPSSPGHCPLSTTMTRLVHPVHIYPSTTAGDRGSTKCFLGWAVTESHHKGDEVVLSTVPVRGGNNKCLSTTNHLNTGPERTSPRLKRPGVHHPRGGGGCDVVLAGRDSRSACNSHR